MSISERPLTELLRPKDFDDFVGQDHLFGEDGILKKTLKTGNMFSAVLYGPPGSGKTSVLSLLERYFKGEVVYLSSTVHGVSEIKNVLKRGEQLKRYGKKLLLFLDEIHRLNRNQQTVLVTHVERGDVVLVATTTENPSFAVIPALLSRCKILYFKQLSENDLLKIIEKAVERLDMKLNHDVKKALVRNAEGDARRLLNTLEIVHQVFKNEKVTIEDLTGLFGKSVSYSKEEHYDFASAFIKSMRGSDPNAAIYYLVKMIDMGEDPRFIARRMIIFASEDVGLADPNALNLAVSTALAVEHVGLPECLMNLIECAVYLSLAPKSNSVYLAMKKAQVLPVEEVPLLLRNPVTKEMEKRGYGKGYLYPHDFGGFVSMNYLPERLKNEVIFSPKGVGFEEELLERLKHLWPEKYGGDGMSEIRKEQQYKGRKIKIVKGDITREEVDAIVNAANEYLKHGGGVAGAIVRAGGSVIQEESDRIVRERGRIPTGEAVVTGSGNLKARYVIHAVGPVWRGGNYGEDELLYRAVYNALLRAHELNLKSVTMPAISTGIFGFPKERAAAIFARVIKDFIDHHPDTLLEEIRICNIDEETTRVFEENLKL
ncbi:AAA family ATPase [Thermotoga sp.]|uniref:AAA family ATPase n=1 Tax=Thermotoga sp. TaxID=28240 RepID=UPI0025E0CA77|nr:AAA family ATPase [Thermotoga sp.]MCD6550830.1 AAA family ATPase [Thermotoga sp.]